MPTTRFLFWNVNRKPLGDVIAELAHEQMTDVLMLAECELEPADLLQQLNRDGGSEFHYAPGACAAVQVFTRFSAEFLRPTFESDRVSMRQLMLPAREEVLLVVAHLPSKLYVSESSLLPECMELARQIATEEDKVGHRRTVLVGDLNMNPFEHGMVAASGLHAVMSRQVASREVRTVQGREYRFFYNPMWSHFGDAARDTAGTYYYERAEQVNYFWNMFDQVLMRPELAQRFDPSRLSIVTAAVGRALIRPDGRPLKASASDHLPVTFDLSF